MIKEIRDKISKFAALHPQVVMYGISLGVTLGIALAVSFAMSPHDVLASTNSNKSHGTLDIHSPSGHSTSSGKAHDI